MPTWLWITIAVAVLLGVVELILLPEQRRRRGLPKNTVNMPSRAGRRADAAGVDPVVGMNIRSGPNQGQGPV